MKRPSLEGLCGHTAEDMDGIEGEVTHIRLEGVDDPVACPLQYDDEEQATGYGKARSDGAHLIAHNGAVYLLKRIQHGVFISSEYSCQRDSSADRGSLRCALSDHP